MVGAFVGYGMILQVLAMVHFMRRRPDNYWIWIILMGGGLGAAAYLLVEALPDVALLQASFRRYPRRARIRHLQVVLLDNPAPGNYEELADLYREDGQVAAARDAYNHAITSRTDSVHPFYGRALCCLDLQDFAAAAADLERVVKQDRNHDYGRAMGLLAFSLARSGQPERAEQVFQEALKQSTLSETQYHYACFLLDQGRVREASEWAERLLLKQRTLPRYLKRRERPWFRRAAAFLKQLPRRTAAASAS